MKLSNFEIILILICILLLYICIKLFINHMLLRYLLIDQLDWSKYQIDQIEESAEWAIINEVKLRYSHYDDSQAKMHVPTTITNAKEEWGEQCDKVSRTLKRNGMRFLNIDDKQFLLHSLYK